MKFIEDDILELCLSGGGMRPTTLKASEVAELISAYENALLHVIGRDNPELNLDSIFISLVDIQENSSHYKFIPSVRNVAFAAAFAINTSISTNTLANLPYKTVESLGEIWKFTKKKNCQAEFLGKTLPKAVIVPEVPIKITKDFYFEGETTIYGRVERVGGATPKVRVKMDNDKILFLDIDEAIAKKLANRLYESVALKGFAKWRKDDYSIEDFKIEEIRNFEESEISDSLKELQSVIGSFWDKIENSEDYILKSRYEKEDY